MSLSVVAVQPPAAIYREEQRFGWWLYAILGVMMVVAWTMLAAKGGNLGAVAAVPHGRIFVAAVVSGLALPILLIAGVLRMTTVVTPTGVQVWFGFIPTYRKAVDIGAIAAAEVVQYRPIRDYGGWGIRVAADGERVLNARGDRGVRLTMVDGSKLLVGSQRPDELALAVRGALRPDA